MKFVKLLTVPAAAMVALMFAIPAYANHALVSKLTATCDQTDKICFHIEFTPSEIDSDRTITVELFAKNAAGALVDTSVGHDILIKQGTTTLQTVDFCFKSSDIDQAKFPLTSTTFVVQVKPGEGIDLGEGSKTVTDTFKCPMQSPPQQQSPPAPQQSSSPTATPVTTTLAQTGGFDFRFPLIGLVLLVAGGALYVVSASRGRSTDTK